MKRRFPFRLGTTSYILPDDILPNVRWLADRVDDVQLLLFESAEASNLPSPAGVRELAAIGRDSDLTYTLHFPLDVYLGHPSPAERRRSTETCLRIMDLCGPLASMTCALHLAPAEPEDRGEDPSPDLAAWQAACDASLSVLAAAAPSSRCLCVETLAYRFDVVDDLLERHDLGVCLDIGHLLLGGYDVGAHLDKYRDRLHLMHLHGVKDGKDHHSLNHLDPEWRRRTVAAMSTEDASVRVMTVEVFSEKDFNESMEVLAHADIEGSTGDRGRSQRQEPLRA